MSTFAELDPAVLMPHPLNVEVFGEEVDDDFLQDVQENGVQTAIEVMALQETSDGYRLPAGRLVILKGHRRVTAALMAGQKSIPCLVRDPVSPVAAELELLRDNLPKLRRNLTPDVINRMVKAIDARAERGPRGVGRPKNLAVTEVAAATGLSERSVRDAIAVAEAVEAKPHRARTLLDAAQHSLRMAAEAAKIEYEKPEFLPDPIPKETKKLTQNDFCIMRRKNLTRALIMMDEIAKAFKDANDADKSGGGKLQFLDEAIELHDQLNKVVRQWMKHR